MEVRHKPKPSYAAVYAAALYPEWVELFRLSGYALAVHGSLQRDFDLIAVPWADGWEEPQSVVDEILAKYAVRQIGEPKDMRHGRRAWTLSIGHGECAVDLSFMPTQVK